jgi:hypothetical protein
MCLTSSSLRIIGVLWCAALFGSGCAFDLADVQWSPAHAQFRTSPEQAFVLAEEVYISGAPCGYSRTLRPKTRWELSAALPQGEVFRSRDQILTVECSNVFEAYLVVATGQLVGFYLPVEKGFVSLPEPISLPIAP